MSVKTLRWGLFSAAGICDEFVGDLLLDPATRNVSDVKHQVVAVASRSGKAQTMLKRIYGKAGKEDLIKDIKVYDDYAPLLADPNVEILYVATCQSHHYAHVKMCLEAGKNVLCEKPFTINAKQAEALCTLAKQKGLFLMEARWLKFFNLFREVRKLVVEDKVLGTVHRVHSDFGEGLPLNHRLFDRNLGGGSLLDIGIYPLTFISSLLWDTPENGRAFPRITSSFRINEQSQCDEDATVVMQFDQSKTTGLLTSNIRTDLHRPSHHTVVYGEKGHLTIGGTHTSRPTEYTVWLKGQEPKRYEPALPGWGMMYEADECARCIRDGKLESDVISHEESLYSMRVLDEARRQHNYVFPAEIEAVS